MLLDLIIFLKLLCSSLRSNESSMIASLCCDIIDQFQGDELGSHDSGFKVLFILDKIAMQQTGTNNGQYMCELR